MKEFQIGKNDSGQRLDKYLRKLLPQAGSSFLYKMLRKKNIVLNDKKAEGSRHITAGDRVTIYFSDETFEKFSARRIDYHIPAGIPEEKRLDILYEDCDILVINKPAGMLSQKAGPGDISANERVIQYLLESGSVTKEELKTFRPAVCNRLDRNTSGILIAGKTMHGLQTISRQLKDRSIAKYYRCIAEGVLDQPRHLQGWLCKDYTKNQVRIYNTAPDDAPDTERKGCQYIETEYHTVQQYDDCAMLEVHLITGRPHQIRAHLASAGHPLIGDAKYGNPRTNEKFYRKAGVRRQLLHAYRVVFPDGTEVTAPLPADFQKTLLLLDKETGKRNL